MFFHLPQDYPNDLGLLFQMDDKGQTACERAFTRYGNDETMAVIGELSTVNDAPFVWSSKLQTETACSTMESE